VNTKKEHLLKTQPYAWNRIAVNAVQQSNLNKKKQNMTTLNLIKSIGRSPSRLAFLLVILALACFALSPTAHAQLPSPTLDGGYPGLTTAEGQNALFSLTTGSANQQLVGFRSRASPPAASTPLSALGRSFSTPQTKIRRLARWRFYSTQPAALNTAVGAVALLNNTEGSANTANGSSALYSNTTGNQNTANGQAALFSNTTGNFNTANGVTTLNGNTTGADNTADGYQALFFNTTGSLNSALGAGAGNGVTTADHVICIGANVNGANVSNTTWIANVYGNATLNGQSAPVIVSVDGQLGTVVSSERFKKDIATMEKASEVILSLRPVTFHDKTDTKAHHNLV
jgi:hypothetical protein